MLTYAVIVFAIGALGGLVLASYVLRAKLAPWALSLLHAALGAVGLLLVIHAGALDRHLGRSADSADHPCHSGARRIRIRRPSICVARSRQKLSCSFTPVSPSSAS